MTILRVAGADFLYTKLEEVLQLLLAVVTAEADVQALEKELDEVQSHTDS